MLIVSFVALATLWPRPRLQVLRERAVLAVPAALEVLGGALGVAAFVFVVYAGYAGIAAADANLAPTFIFYVFWVGVPFASALLGDVFALFNPWRALARGVAAVGLGRAAPRRRAAQRRWRTRAGWAAGRRRSASWLRLGRAGAAVRTARSRRAGHPGAGSTPRCS